MILALRLHFLTMMKTHFRSQLLSAWICFQSLLLTGPVMAAKEKEELVECSSVASAVPLPAVAAPQKLFQGTSVLEMSVRSDWALIRSLLPLEATLTKETRTKFPGFFVTDNGNLAATFQIKGNTSAGRFDFPKLKFRFEKPLPTLSVPLKPPPMRPSLFAEVDGFSINTHGYDLSIDREDGFAQGDKTPFREATAYELAAAAGLPTRAVRRAQVTYVSMDSSPTFVKPALLLEREGDFFKRLGAKEIELQGPMLPPTVCLNTPDVELAKIVLFHSMLGNWDYMIPPGLGFHNLMIGKMKTAENQFRVVLAPEDFDNAAAVRGEATDQGTPRIEWPSDDLLEKYVASLILERRKKYSIKTWQLAAEDLKQRKPEILKALEVANVDERGRKNFEKYITAFFAVVDKALLIDLADQ